MRIGYGYDAHRLKVGRKCILCGVEVPCDFGPDGHSDADVPIHALMDAMLGAMAIGDIGKLFPDTDNRYKMADSMELLRIVFGKVKECGYIIGNADITIITQAPRLASYIDLMRANLAVALETDIMNVSVKATSEEGMGFTGDGTGIAASAVVLLRVIV